MTEQQFKELYQLLVKNKDKKITHVQKEIMKMNIEKADKVSDLLVIAVKYLKMAGKL